MLVSLLICWSSFWFAIIFVVAVIMMRFSLQLNFFITAKQEKDFDMKK